MKTVTGKANAWITNYSSIGPVEFRKPDFNPAQLNFTDPDVDMKAQGWTFVGSAEITVDLIDSQELVDNKVAALREELKTVRAAAHRKTMELEDKIANLLAITYEPSDGAA